MHVQPVRVLAVIAVVMICTTACSGSNPTAASTAPGPRALSGTPEPAPSSSALTTSRHPQNHDNKRIQAAPSIEFADVVNRNFAVVDGYTNSSEALWATTPAAQHFRRISPPGLRLAGGVEGIDFLDSHTGWFLTYTTTNATERIYRTQDGGRHWRSFSAPTHVEGGPAYDTIHFLTPRRGWLTDSEPSAPSYALYVTRDAGATWHPVNRTDVPRNSRPNELPNAGPAQFTSKLHGYDSGISNSYEPLPTFATSDGGRTWHRTSVPHGRNQRTGPLTISNGRPVIAVTRCGEHAQLRLFTQARRRAPWTGSTTLHASPTSSQCQVNISAPTPHTAWALLSETRTATVARLDSSGHWHTTSPLTPSQAQDQLTIQSVNSRDAWIVFQEPEQHYLLVTTNAGRTWTKAHLPRG